MNTKTLIIIFLFVFALPNLFTADYEINWEKISSGGIIVEPDKFIKNKKEIFGVRAYFIVKADIDRIWSVLTDYDHFLEIFKSNGLVKINVIKKDENGAEVELWQEVKKLRLKIHYVMYRKYIKNKDQKIMNIVWTRVSSEILKTIEGSWEIKDTERSGEYLLIYRSFADGFIPLSKIIQKGALKEAGEMAKQVRLYMRKRGQSLK